MNLYLGKLFIDHTPTIIISPLICNGQIIIVSK